MRRLDLEKDEIVLHDSMTLFYRTLGGGAATRRIKQPFAGDDGRLDVTNETIAPLARQLVGRIVQRANRVYAPSNLPPE